MERKSFSLTSIISRQKLTKSWGSDQILYLLIFFWLFLADFFTHKVQQIDKDLYHKKTSKILFLVQTAMLIGLTLFSLGFMGLLRPGGIFSFPLSKSCSSNAKSFKFCRKKLWHDDVIILDDVSIFLLLHFVTCLSLFSQ